MNVILEEARRQTGETDFFPPSSESPRHLNADLPAAVMQAHRFLAMS